MTTALTTTILIASGLATRYDPGVMDTVVKNRVRWGQLEPCRECVGYVALLTCDRLGDKVWLDINRTTVPVQVADCAQAAHRPALVARGWAVDLGYPLAQRFGVLDAPAPGVKVWEARPRHRLPVRRAR